MRRLRMSGDCPSLPASGHVKEMTRIGINLQIDGGRVHYRPTQAFHHTKFLSAHRATHLPAYLLASLSASSFPPSINYLLRSHLQLLSLAARLCLSVCLRDEAWRNVMGLVLSSIELGRIFHFEALIAYIAGWGGWG